MIPYYRYIVDMTKINKMTSVRGEVDSIMIMEVKMGIRGEMRVTEEYQV